MHQLYYTTNMPMSLLDAVVKVGHLADMVGSYHITRAHHALHFSAQPLLSLRIGGQVVEDPGQYHGRLQRS